MHEHYRPDARLGEVLLGVPDQLAGAAGYRRVQAAPTLHHHHDLALHIEEYGPHAIQDAKSVEKPALTQADILLDLPRKLKECTEEIL